MSPSPIQRLLRTLPRTFVPGALAALAPGVARASEGGIVIIPEPTLLVGLIVGFAVLVVPVNRLLLQPLLRVLEERAERIQGPRERARKLAEQADGILARYENEVERVRAEATAERRETQAAARREELAATGAARGEAEQEMERVRREIRAALDDARSGLRASTEELARAAAERILGRPLA